jgi:hypothetical protein
MTQPEKLFTLDQVRKAMERGGVDMEYRGEDILIQLADDGESHEARKLRHTLKAKCQELGKMGPRIYDLRCQLAEARSITNHGDRSFHRTMLQANREQAKVIGGQLIEIEELKAKLAEASVNWVPRAEAFHSGGQTYETPQRPTVSVPRPNPSGRPTGGGQL